MSRKNKSTFLESAVNNRTTIGSALFIALFTFVVGSQFAIEYFELGDSGFLIQISVSVFLTCVIIGWLIYSSNLKSKMLKQSILQEKKVPDDPLESFEEAATFGSIKIRIFFASFGTLLGITTILFLILTILGLENYISTIMPLFMLFGWIILFPILWKIYFIKFKR